MLVISRFSALPGGVIAFVCATNACPPKPRLHISTETVQLDGGRFYTIRNFDDGRGQHTVEISAIQVSNPTNLV